MHATAVTASQSVPAGRRSMRTVASCYNFCMHSLPGPQYVFVLNNNNSNNNNSTFVERHSAVASEALHIYILVYRTYIADCVKSVLSTRWQY